MIALAEALLEMPIISSLDLRDNRITDDVLDPRTKQPLYPPLPEYTRYVTNVNLKGNEVSASVLQELSQYIDVLRREDKRLEIRAALNRIDRNSDGGIDEEEFKGVLKLLTTSTPTKKEVRAFMQQHTLSTDSSQNAANLENVLLAKCAVSPSRHSACPPWEALVQERHAVLGAPRMAPTVLSAAPDSPSPAPSKARLSQPSLPTSGSGIATENGNPFAHSNSAPDVSPLSSPASQIAPVAPIEMINALTKPPPAPTVNISVTPLQPQYPSKMSEPKLGSLSADPLTTLTRPPAVPILPLASVTQHPVSPSPRSARSSIDDEGQRNPSSLAREAGPGSMISAPSSPHDSDVSDSLSVISSAFGGAAFQRILDDQNHVNAGERKPHAAHTAQPILDSPRWQSEHISGEDDEQASSGCLSGAREEADELSSGDVDDDVRSAYSHQPPKSLVASGSSTNELSDNKSVSNPSRRDASFPGSETPREVLSKGSEYSSTGHDEKRSLPGSVVSTPRFDDLSSLVYRGAEEGGRAETFNSLEKSESPVDQPEEDAEVEECVESLMFDVIKDGKERYVVKLIHSEFKNGLLVKDFPAELPLRNLLALLLPENGLSDLTLLTEVLDLGENQLKTISGLTKMFQLRAVCFRHNAIRTVKNVEHLVQLEILHLANNQIATVHALRLLSLNKVLSHLNLDGNPVVETDERQKRKNIVHVRNLLPALQSLGSIPCAGLHTKDKKKANITANPGKCLFDSDLMPDYKAMWLSVACDSLHILQDSTSKNTSQSEHDDDEWDTRDEDGGEDKHRKPLTREQQRQKDELRSRAIGFRSRGKAIPSPPKVKTSVYCFGPPQPAPVKKKKKPIPVDPNIVKEQQRRASELSAPKHTPVDKTLMRQEQKRKSRVDFQGAMTVGERLQLARDMTQRRPTATVGLSARSRSILAKADSRKRASTVSSANLTEQEVSRSESNVKCSSRSPNPQHPSPIKDAMVFRIDPTNTPRSPKGVLTFRVDPNPAGLSGQPNSPKPKEAGFLHDLAVSDFLNHAEEEFSTALTALNVLLSMSEKEQGDRKKLADYRASLNALDILNEHESHDLFKKAQEHPEHELQTQCTEWFTKLGVVKKCMRQLLEKLEVHAPGSGVIRAYCRYIRLNELRGIIITMLEAQEEAISQPNAAEETVVIVGIDNVSDDEDHDSLQSVTSTVLNKKANQPDPASGSVTSRLFGDAPVPVHDEDNGTSYSANSTCTQVHQTSSFSTGDTDLDFLESSDTVWEDGNTREVKETTPVSHSFNGAGNAANPEEHPSIPDSIFLAATTDITMDIQMNDDFSESNQHADEIHGTDIAADDNAVELATSYASEDVSEVQEQVEEAYESEIAPALDHNNSFGEEGEDRPADMLSQAEPASSNNDDYDWLASSTELDADVNTADSFEKDMATVSGDESEGEVTQDEIVEEDWSNTEQTEQTIQEETEASEEVFNGETYINEETNESGELEENGDYSEGAEAEAEAETTEVQYELAEGVDADDEEAETYGDWEKGFDPNSNHYFWFNHSTGESSWTPPEGWPYEVDDPFNDEEAEAGEEQQEQEYDEGTTDAQENEEAAAEGQDYYDEGAEGQYYEEGAEAQEYEEGTAEGQYYEEGAVEGQQYEESTADDQYYEETAAKGQAYEEGTGEEQQYEEGESGGQWYDENATEDQSYEAVEEEQQVEQAGEESPRRSEVSDFEFDDSDLPGF
ncbi:unnamed protein product [Phytophthora lilii]|uniref:Unnamed protein product n=1 Tax=Phytophthora lilii TaxID=2077276 RepID=A0A9W6WLL5_9STRA|nr:unnamed protein product [Phytophthora lilii]